MGRLLVGILVIAVLVLLWPYYSYMIPFVPHLTPAPPVRYTPGTPAPTATPEAWRTDQNHPINRFVTLMTAADTTFHLETKISASSVAGSGFAGESWDVSGADFTVDASFNTDAGVQSERYVRKGQDVYDKEPGAAWIKLRDFEGRDVFYALPSERYRIDRFVGIEGASPQASYHFVMSVSGWPLRSTELMLISGAPGSAKWDVWVDGNGSPLRAAMQGQFNGVIDRRSIPVNMSFEYTFSKVGEPVTVEVPAAFR